MNVRRFIARSFYYRIMMHDGLGMDTGSPTGVRPPVLSVNPKHDDIVARHVGAQQQFTTRCDRQVLRALAQARLIFQQRELTVLADAVRGNAVVSSVRAVQEIDRSA